MKFFVHRDGSSYGPYDDARLLELLKAGRVARTDLVAQVGTEDWKPLDQVFQIAPDTEASTRPRPSALGFTLTGSAQAQAIDNTRELSDAGTKVTTAAMSVFVIGAMNILFGLLDVLTPFQTPRFLGHGPHVILAGILMVILGVFVSRKSAVALALALAVYLLDSILWFSDAPPVGALPWFVSIGIRIAFLIWIASGFSGMKRLGDDQKRVG